MNAPPLQEQFLREYKNEIESRISEVKHENTARFIVCTRLLVSVLKFCHSRGGTLTSAVWCRLTRLHTNSVHLGVRPSRVLKLNSTTQYVEIKCQLDATEVFIADLIACSTCFGHHYAHHQELKSIIQRWLPVVFRAVVFKLLVWCGAEGYVSGLQDAAASCKPDT